MRSEVVERRLHTGRIGSLRRNAREVLCRTVQVGFTILPEVVNLEEIKAPLLEFKLLHKGGKLACGLLVPAPTIGLFRIPGAVARNLRLELYGMLDTDCVRIGFKACAAVVEIADHELFRLNLSTSLHKAVSIIE